MKDLPHKHPHHFIINLPVLLIPHRQINPSLFIYNTFVMGEGSETVDSVVGAHAAFAETTESHIAGCEMDENIVDAAAAETAPGSYFLGGFFVVSEDVESQGMSHGVDPGDGTSERVVGEDWKYRAKDLLLHDRIIKCYIIKDRWLDLERFAVGTAAADCFGRINEAVDTVEMFFIDDLSIIAVFERFFSILTSDLSAKFCN